MGKKTPKKSRRRESPEEEEEREDAEEALESKTQASQDSWSSEVDGAQEAQKDAFLEGIDGLESKKASSRLKGLAAVLSALQSGADLFDLALSHMDDLIGHLKRLLTHRTSKKETLLSMKVVNILSLVMGAESNAFADEFRSVLVSIATRGSAEETEIRIAAVRALAFTHFICYDANQGYPCFQVVGDIAMLQSEGTDVPAELQAAAADAWCLLANMLDPEKVCNIARNEDFLIEILPLLESSHTEIKLVAADCIAFLWEVADRISPGQEAADSGTLFCDDEGQVQHVLHVLSQVGKESVKKVNKKERKERKSALKSVSDWVISGEPPSGETVHLQGAEIEFSSFAEMRILEFFREVLKGGFQTCLRVFPVTREILEADYMMPDEQSGSSEVAGGGGITCDAFEKRVVRSAVRKVKNSYRRNQRADKAMMQQAECVGL